MYLRRGCLPYRCTAFADSITGASAIFIPIDGLSCRGGGDPDRTFAHEIGCLGIDVLANEPTAKSIRLD